MTDPDVNALILDLAEHAGNPRRCLELLADHRDEHGEQATLIYELALAETFGSCMTRTTTPGAPVPVSIPTKESN